MQVYFVGAVTAQARFRRLHASVSAAAVVLLQGDDGLKASKSMLFMHYSCASLGRFGDRIEGKGPSVGL